MLAQLTVERRSARFGETLRRWFDGGLAALGGKLLDELDATPLRGDALRNYRAGEPYGPPGSLWAMLSVTRQYPKGPRKLARVYTAQEWSKFLDSCDENVMGARFMLTRLDSDGLGGIGGFVLEMQASDRDPNWIYLEAIFGESWLAPLDHQRELLAHVREVGELCDPTFGQIDYLRAIHRSPLESALAMIPNDEVSKSRRRLRGYSWLTICSQQIGDDLGGVDQLAATEAFAQVAHLGDGGYWLLATPTFQEYDMTAVERVFRAMASKLPAGKPLGLGGTPDPYSSPDLLVNQNAANLTQ